MADLSQLSDDELKQIAEGGDFRTGVSVPTQGAPDMSMLSDAELQKIASGEDDSHWFGPGGKVPQWMNEHPNVRSLTKGTLDLLPVAGATAGGAVGTAAGLASSAPTGFLSAPVVAPVAGVAGAGLGGGMGKSLQNLGEDALLGEGRTAEQQLKEPITAAEDYATAQGAGDLAGAGIKAAANLPIVQKGAGKINNALAGTGEWLSGVPKKVIQTFAKNPDEIAAMNKAADGSTAEAADQIREKLTGQIAQTKKQLNDVISDSLKNADPNARHDVSSIIQRLEAEKAKYNPKAQPEIISDIDDLINRVKAFTPGEYTPDYGKGLYNKTSARASDMPYPAKPDGAYGMERQYGITPKPPEPPSKVDMDAADEMASNIFAKPGVDRTPSTMRVAGANPSYVPPKAVDNTVSSVDLNRIKQMLQDEASGAYARPGEIFNHASPRAQAARSAGGEARTMLNTAHPDIAKANNTLSELHDIEDTMNKNLIAPGKPEAALVAAGTGGNERNAKALSRLGEITGTDMNAEADKLAAMKTFGSPSFSPATSTGAKVYHAGAGALLGGAAGYAEGGREGAIGGALAGAALSSPAAVKAAIQGGQGFANVARTAIATPAGKQAIGNLIMGGDSTQPSPAPNAPVSVPDLAGQMKQSPRLDALSKTNPKAFEAIQNAIQGRMKPKELDKDSSTSSQIPENPAQSQQRFIQGN